MKIIFLNIDGVLNAADTKARCGDCVGIDGAMVKRLRKIVEATKAEIVLSSPWRLGYNKDHQPLEHYMKYLGNKLGNQRMRVVGMTPDLHLGDRGIEINKWLNTNSDVVDNYVILDNENFYDGSDLYQHFVHIYDGGLQDRDIDAAIKILNGELNEKRTEEEKSNKIAQQKVDQEVSVAKAQKCME